MPFSFFVMLICERLAYLLGNFFALLSHDPGQKGKEPKSNRCLHFSQFFQIRSGNYFFVFFIVGHAEKM